MLRSLRDLTALLSLGALLSILAGCHVDAPIAQERDGGGGARCDAPIECPAPPEGCRYQGADPCTTCGTLVCIDGGTPTDEDAGCLPVDCAAPPEGCRYEGASLCDCGRLVCDGVLCAAAGVERFPTFERACETATDCVAVEHQVNCCGTDVLLGIRADEQVAFDEAEATCRGMYPGCGCAEGPTTADDGTTADGVAGGRVECRENVCTSTFVPAERTRCEPGSDTCGPGTTCCYPCGVMGCEHECMPTCTDPTCFEGCHLFP
jgi:hypothetical protein